MTRPQPPQILSDLYRDLRDRRLLIPVIALLVALIAVPVLLGSGTPATVPPAPVATIDLEDASAVQSAVFVEDTGVRNYRKRLEALKDTNPFNQKFAAPSPDEAAAAAETATATEAPTGSPTTPPDPPVDLSSAPGGGSLTDPSSSSPPAPTLPPSDSAGTPEDPDATVEDPDDQFRFYEGTANFVFGPLGETKRYEDVKRFVAFPNEREGVIAFLGLSVGNDRAYFLLSPQVVESDGDGSCSPKKPAPCQFLELSIGEERIIKAADPRSDEVTTYRLKLTATDIVEVADPRE